MADRIYYVICEDNCKFESMTKEQIIAAIEEATGNVPTGYDEAFITKIKEQNSQSTIKLWIGTKAQYNNIQTKALDTIYVIRQAGQPITGGLVDLTQYDTSDEVNNKISQAIGMALDETY